MNAQHTPGPWGLEDRDDGASGYILRGADGDLIEYIERSRYMHDIADPEQEANARLIAAAPELLEVLEWVENTGMMEHGGGGDMIRAAIAKAKGIQP